ncbi:MAG: tetratricopeptide repeat protein [Verrucomicrobiota bacterium]
MSRRSNNNATTKKVAAARPAGSQDRWTIVGVSIFLVAITWIVFGQTLHFEFINFDDGDYVYKNPPVARGLTLAGIVWAFTHTHAANWHPVTWISHMLDCQLYGLSPSGHHLSNVVIHAATVILLFLVLRQMTSALWRSAFVAAVFAIHPLRVESVAWVAERKDLLSGLFFMLTIAAYIRYTRRPSPWSYGALLLALTLGLMSKPMLVTVPVVLLLLDYWPLHRRTLPDNAEKGPLPRALILEKLPLLGLVAASCALTLIAQKVAIQPLTHLPSTTRIGNTIISYVVYVGQMLWPFALTPYYPLRIEDAAASKVLLSFLLLLGISAVVFVYRRRRYLVTGWLWYLVMLVPVIGIIQVGNQAHADRYTYLPQIGLYLALTWVATDLCVDWRHHRLILAAFAITILTALTLAARTYTSYWKESELLWSYTLTHSSNNAMAELNLGEAVHKKGRVDEAITHLTKAVAIQPDNATSHGALGIALLTKGRRDEAFAHLRKSLELNPEQAPVHSSLGMALLELGQPEESLAHLRTALEIDPDDGDAHYNLGNTLLQMGQASGAVMEYEQALGINPKDTQALNNLAWVLATCPDASIRDGIKAVELAKRADSLTSGRSQVITATLAAAYAEAGRPSDAVTAGERALQLAMAEENRARADSIGAQIKVYQSGAAFRDNRSFPPAR